MSNSERLTDLLVARAEKLTVIDDEDAVHQLADTAPLLDLVDANPALGPNPAFDSRPARPTPQLRRSSPTIRAVFAAAAVAIVAASGLGLARTATRSENPTNADARTEEPQRVEPSDSEIEMIVWVKPEATEEEVDAILLVLTAHAEVTDVDYVDRQETYDEFAGFFVENPEVLEAVTPEDLPTSFRVVTSDSDAVVGHLRSRPTLTAIDSIDLGYDFTGPEIGYLSCDRLGLQGTPILAGVERDKLASGLGWYPSTARPGEGNTAIAGTRTTYGQPFLQLDKLLPGDSVEILTATGRFRYEVIDQGGSGHRIVDPTDVEVLDDSLDANGVEPPMLTLTSTHPEYSSEERIVVQARLVESQSD